MSIQIHSAQQFIETSQRQHQLQLAFSLGLFLSIFYNLLLVQASFGAEPTVRIVRASGNLEQVTQAVEECRALLGAPLNAAAVGEQPEGRREINWDGVQAPNLNTDTFPANFFNTTSPRGLIMSTTGTGFRISSNNFSDVDESYPSQFAPFSGTKTLGIIGSNTLDVFFKVSGDNRNASVSGFCVIFSDVDTVGSTYIELLQGNESLNVVEAPVRSGNSSFSVVGAIYTGKRVTRVRITSGTGNIGSTIKDISENPDSPDLVIMDDFLYGEPRLDIDADGVVDAADASFPSQPSDVRQKLELNGGNTTFRLSVLGLATIDNSTLGSGLTLQDLVNACRVVPIRRQVGCIRDFLKLSDAISPLTNAQYTLAKKVFNYHRRLPRRPRHH